MINSCAALDVGDRRGYIATDELSPADARAALQRALFAEAFDGPRDARPGAFVIRGTHTVAKAQHRTHERFESLAWFEAVRASTGIPAPRLLDSGTAEGPHGEVWWAVLRRIRASEVTAPTPARQRAIGDSLRRWHENAPAHGLRLDDDGGLGVFLGGARGHLTHDGYLAFGAALAEACAGLPMTPVHGDVAVCHNAMFRGDDLGAVIDPGAVHLAPPLLDLAWCLAVDLAHGAASRAPLLEGYGADGVAVDALEALLPVAQLRLLIDLALAEAHAAFGRLAGTLSRRVPGLVRSTGVLEPALGGIVSTFRHQGGRPPPAGLLST